MKTKIFAATSNSEKYETIQSKVVSMWLSESCDNILEIGCSAGYFTKYLSQIGRQVYGIDINSEHIAQAARRYPFIAFQVADASRLPFKSESFDLVVMLEVIEHVGNEEQTIAEIHRVLKPSGKLLISTPNTGLFTFLDPFNVKLWFRQRLPLIAALASGMARYENTQYRENLRYHRHYSLDSLQKQFDGKFRIKKVHRGGLLFFPLCSGVQSAVSRITAWDKPKIILQKLMNLDGRIQYGRFGYNLIIAAERLRG